MRFLVLLALVASAVSLPRKPNKDFPKKYDPTVDGIKNTYGHYEIVLSEDILPPVDHVPIDRLVPPSSYDAYFEQQAEDPILPPDVSSYTDVQVGFDGVDLVAPVDDSYMVHAGHGQFELMPPPVDTYSVHAGQGQFVLAPPPATPEALSEQGSYVTYDGLGDIPLAVPSLSTYAEDPTDKSGADVLSSLVAMVQSLPKAPTSSSYTSYQESTINDNKPGSPSLEMRPPNPVQEATETPDSSYAHVPEQQPTFSPVEIDEMKKEGVSPPSAELVPPPSRA